MANIFEYLNMLPLSRETLQYALEQDHCLPLRGPPGSTPRPSKSTLKLQELSNAYGPNLDPAYFGLRPILVEYGSA